MKKLLVHENIQVTIGYYKFFFFQGSLCVCLCNFQGIISPSSMCNVSCASDVKCNTDNSFRIYMECKYHAFRSPRSLSLPIEIGLRPSSCDVRRPLILLHFQLVLKNYKPMVTIHVRSITMVREIVNFLVLSPRGTTGGPNMQKSQRTEYGKRQNRPCNRN